MLIVSAQTPVTAQVSLTRLYENHQYFELRDELSKRPTETSPALLFYRGIVANRFNELQKSNELFK